MELEPREAAVDPPPRDRTQTIVRRSGSSDSGRESGRPLTPAAVTPPNPSPVDDNFELLAGDPDRYTNNGEHARGGLGRVLRARDHRLGRTVAIKELLHQSDAGESRFVREALITARLQHPGIVPVHEAGRWPNGEPYYVMKLISGRSMKQLIRAAESFSERMALLPNVIAVAEAVAYAHSEHVIHRDIKPANVMVGEFGETVVVDWGIAKDRSGAISAPTEAAEGAESAPESDQPAADDDSERRPTTGPMYTAGVLGTPCYMPPEQAAGEDVDERADVYALGALLYEVLAGEQPYSGPDDSGDILARVLAGPPAPLQSHQSGVPPDLLAVVSKAMARDPRDRYRSAKEVAEDLKRFQTGQLVTAHHYSTMTLVKRWMWRNRALVGVAVVAMAALGVLGSLAVNSIIDERNLAQAERTQAERATRSTEDRRRQLLLLQARSSLDRDPTAAVAWLKTYPETAEGKLTLRAMVDEAESLGVARHVLRLGDWGFGVAFSPDNRQLATIANDKSVRIFELATGSSRTLGHHSTPAQSVRFSVDGTQLITGTENGELGFWQLASGKHTVVKAHRSTVWDAAFAPDGRRATTVGGRQHLLIWDTESKTSTFEAKGPAAVSAAGDFAVTFDPKTQQPRVIEVSTGELRKISTEGFKPKGKIHQPAISNGGEQLMIMDSKGGIWHHAKASGWRMLGSHYGKLDSAQFSPSGRMLATMGFNQVIQLFHTRPQDEKNAKGSAYEGPRFLRGHVDAIYMMEWSADERYAVTASDDGTARVWDLQSGITIRVLRGHSDDVYRVAISPDQKYIATISLDESVRLWESGFQDQRRLRQGAPVTGMAWLDENSLISHDRAAELLLWNVRTQERKSLARLAPPSMYKRSHSGGAMSKSRKRAAGIAEDGNTVLVFDTVTGQTARLAQGSLESPSVWGFSPDAKRLLVTYRKGGVVMWDVDSKEPLVLASGDYDGPAALSPDGQEIALYHGETLTLWDVGEQKTLLEKSAKDLGVSESFMGQRVGYSPDGRWVAAISMLGEIAVLDRRTGRSKVLKSGEDKLTSVEFSPDGRYMSASAADRTVRLWDVESGKQRIFAGHTDLVYKARFSPDSKTLASSSYDKTARLWDIESGRSRVLRGHAGAVDSVEFSPSGDQLATGSRDGTIRIWKIRDALAPVDAEAMRARMRAITSATIAADDQPETLTLTP